MEKGSIEELIKYVNEQLKTGLSTAQIEKNMNAGKDTIRKKLNRAGYKFNREIKQFVMNNNKVITRNNTDNTSIKKESITHDNTCVIDKNDTFSNEDVELLKEMLQEYKNRKKTQELDNVIIDSNIITRSFRSYKIVLDNFADYCKANNLSQKDAIAVALTDFMKNH